MRPQTVMLATACLVAAASAAASRYDEPRAAAVKRCEAIDPQAYQTGMIFNSEGHRSAYLRSACLQDAAVAFRDASPCAQVRERRSSLFSSWGYSGGRCRQLVGEALAADRKALAAIRTRYAKGAVLRFEISDAAAERTLAFERETAFRPLPRTGRGVPSAAARSSP